MGELSLFIINVPVFFPTEGKPLQLESFWAICSCFANSIGCFRKHIKRTYFHSFYYIILSSYIFFWNLQVRARVLYTKHSQSGVSVTSQFT